MANHANPCYRYGQGADVTSNSTPHAGAGDQPDSDLSELLDHHFQEMIQRGDGKPRRTTARPAGVETGISQELAALMELALTLHRVIVPVRPSDDFREELHQALIAEHRRRSAQRALFVWTDRNVLPNRWWRVAATAPFLLGILAYLWHRNNRSEETAEVGV
jgi:hypothetical protein